MSYVPSTSAEQQAMLKAIGVESLEELLTAIPDEVRFHGALDLPPALREADVRRAVSALAAKNASAAQAASFLGAGTYEHVIPSVVPHLMKRSEFYTSYTPYQPEVSQGMLQAIYEFQTMVCEISGMDVANASLYDGSTAVVEGALLAVGPEGTGEVLVSRAVDPQYRATLRTYAWARGFTVREIELDGGVTALAKLEAAITPETKAVIIQHPNFFGCLEDVYGVEKLVRASKALFIVAISEPASLGILTPPGEYGADIVAAEGGTLGMPPSFGGPALGLFATKGEHVRRMPGRLAGRTVDNRGQTGYVLTLQTREQHIRRERATSNICTNQALLALGATIYLATIGKQGFAEVGEQCLQRAHYAHDQMRAIPGFAPAFDQPFFDEFVMRTPLPAAEINAALEKRGLLGGYDVSADYPELDNAMMFAVTEARSKDDIDALVAGLSESAGKSR